MTYGDLEVYNGNGFYTYQPAWYLWAISTPKLYKINGRVYFIRGNFGIWWNGCDKWLIGYHRHRGQKLGFVFFKNDVLYPHSEFTRVLFRVKDINFTKNNF